MVANFGTVGTKTQTAETNAFSGLNFDIGRSIAMHFVNKNFQAVVQSGVIDPYINYCQENHCFMTISNSWLGTGRKFLIFEEEQRCTFVISADGIGVLRETYLDAKELRKSGLKKYRAKIDSRIKFGDLEALDVDLASLLSNLKNTEYMLAKNSEIKLLGSAPFVRAALENGFYRLQTKG